MGGFFLLSRCALCLSDHGDPWNAVRWQAAERCALSPPFGLYFGDPAYGDYTSGYPMSGRVTTPTFEVPSSGPGARNFAEFQLYLDTEWSGLAREGWENPPPVLQDLFQGGTSRLTARNLTATFRAEAPSRRGSHPRGFLTPDAIP